MSRRYPPEARDKALRLALDHLHKYPSAYAAAHAIGPMLDMHPETLRVWIPKAKTNRTHSTGTHSTRPSAPTPVASTEREELERLHRENQELTRANEILKLASAFSARELHPRHRIDSTHHPQSPSPATPGP